MIVTCSALYAHSLCHSFECRPLPVTCSSTACLYCLDEAWALNLHVSQRSLNVHCQHGGAWRILELQRHRPSHLVHKCTPRIHHWCGALNPTHTVLQWVGWFSSLNISHEYFEILTSDTQHQYNMEQWIRLTGTYTQVPTKPNNFRILLVRMNRKAGKKFTTQNAVTD